MELNSNIFVAGHRGLGGSAVVRALKSRGFTNINTVTREDIDLTDPVAVKWYFSVKRLEYVFMCAAKVGGIKANASDPLGFFLDNMAIETNTINNAAEYGVKKFLFLGSSCIYPKFSAQPIKEEYLLTGPLEPTTEAYALAKIAGVKLCQWYREQRGCDFISAMPCNLYGPNDNYDPEAAHVIPGLIARMHKAKIQRESSFNVWGSPTTRREFLYSDDVADALLFLMDKYSDSPPINVGSGSDLYIGHVAHMVANTIGYRGSIKFDETQPVGTPQKLMDATKIRTLGWAPQISLDDGLQRTYDAFLGI